MDKKAGKYEFKTRTRNRHEFFIVLVKQENKNVEENKTRKLEFGQESKKIRTRTAEFNISI